VLSQPPDAGQREAFSPARHEPFQSVSPSLPDHSLHETSSYVPSIAPRPLGKNAPGAPESVHRSKLRSFFQHNKGLTWKKRKCVYALHGHVIIVEWLRHPLAAPLIVVRSRTQIVDLYDDAVPERARV
jgi:hypothetical protein